MPSLPRRHVAPPSSVSHTPAAEIADREPVRARRATARSSAGRARRRRAASAAGVGCSAERRLSVERRAAVAALEQHARVAARVDGPVSSPGTITQIRSSAASPPRGQLDALRLLPLAAGSSVYTDLRPVERRGDRREEAAASAGRASRTRPARPRTRGAVTSNGAPGSPSSTNRPFLVPSSSSVIARRPRAPAARRSGPRRATGVSCAPELAVHEHVDVAAERAALVEDPAARRRMLALELAQQLADGAAVDRVLGAIAGELLERAAEAHEWHGPDPSRREVCDAGAGAAIPVTSFTPGRAAGYEREIEGGDPARIAALFAFCRANRALPPIDRVTLVDMRLKSGARAVEREDVDADPPDRRVAHRQPRLGRHHHHHGRRGDRGRARARDRRRHHGARRSPTPACPSWATSSSAATTSSRRRWPCAPRGSSTAA